MASKSVTIHELAQERKTRQGEGQGPKSSPSSTKSPDAVSSNEGHSYQGGSSLDCALQFNGDVGCNGGRANQYIDQHAGGNSTQVNGGTGGDEFLAAIKSKHMCVSF